MKRLFSIYVWVAMLTVLPLRAQIPFACSFEENEDLSGWVLNNPSNATDQWIIGEMVHSEGKRSLYISTDGKKPMYGAHPNIVASYMSFKFPETGKQQNYDISFDWKGVGDPDNAKLYVMVCREDLLTNSQSNNPYYLKRIVSSTSGILSPSVVAACEQLGPNGDKFLCGSEQWQNVTLTSELRVNKTNSTVPFAIVFIWVNNNNDPAVRQSGICIDNLQIGDATIKKPKNVQAEPICEDSSMLVSWESTLKEFEVQYRKVGTSTWRRQDGITDGVEGFTRNGLQCSYVLQRIGEATYDVRVLGIAGSLKSNYSYKNLVLVYCPDNHCVNYLDIHGPNVLCNYGYRAGVSSHAGETPYSYVGCIDHGPEAKESRHTVHVDPTEVDPRTDGELLTVPKNALASVRLGNWATSYEAEAITYTIHVDSANQGILIVNYAIVLQKPGEGCGDPEFKMEIFDEDGNELEDLCGVPDFTYSQAVAAGWNRTKDESVVWKDWTTVGVNIMPYNGQTIKVRFTSVDCGAGGHYGYGYFTMDCASARLETENCGNDSRIQCYAPEGFAYRWFNEAGETVGTNRELEVDAGRQEYTCRVSFLDDPTCYFEVKTVSAPRFPVPDYTVEPIYEQCSSKLKFHNTSHVMNKYDGNENHTKEAVQDCHWYFTRLSDRVTTESYNWNPVYTCPDDGDTIVVNYTCYIGENNVCDSTRVDTIVVPNIVPKNTEFHISTCYSDPIQFGGQWFDKDTVFVGIYPNFAGCDSVSTLYLEVFERPDDVYRHDSICSDSSIMIDGLTFNEPMVNKPFILKTVNGCDSVVYVTLTVNERIDVDVDELAYACADGLSFLIPYDVTAGQYDSLQIRFNAPGLRDTTIYDPTTTSVLIPYAPDILPGHYTATLRFHQYCCGIRTEERPFDIRYSNVVITQRWNDVLAIRNADYNGGFTFDSVQWYLGETPIDGATDFNYYAGAGNKLQFGQEYTALLVRRDGVKLFTCPFIPVEVPSDIVDMPTLVNLTSQIPMKGKGVAFWYDMLGRCYSREDYNDSAITTPGIAGYYLLVLQSDEDRSAHRMVVR